MKKQNSTAPTASKSHYLWKGRKQNRNSTMTGLSTTVYDWGNECHISMQKFSPDHAAFNFSQVYVVKAWMLIQNFI